ncbi:protein UPSTREAM OF FLC-like [Canna indica]|uniref:Protein UPSTREAM OF FLC-like n=1 Tax=Canna indica TaxID=4628 RepID=A0AAQ3KVX0_9LILI|nr:protein UPSTREAM OF FLC-like [Canna indica]
MAVAFRGNAREASPDRTKVWTEPKLRAKASVVYYLSRNGQLEHPHFMEVRLSSAEGLYLRDVIGRLRVLRGSAMAGMYAWSSKRRYRNGFVWQDLSVNEFIHPVNGNEYVLKGTELLHLNSPSSCSSSSSDSHGSSTSSSTSSDKPLETQAPAAWSSSDAGEYKVYKNQNKSAEATAYSTDASTQTDEHRRHRRRAPPRKEKPKTVVVAEIPAAQVSREEIKADAETLEALIKADAGRRIAAEDKDRTTGGGCLSGRVKASAMLMHLISCGSISVKANGFSLMPQYMGGLDRAESMGRIPSFRAVRLEEREYFSESLVETKKKTTTSDGNGNGGVMIPSLKRSSSYNADR